MGSLAKVSRSLPAFLRGCLLSFGATGVANGSAASENLLAGKESDGNPAGEMADMKVAAASWRHLLAFTPP